MRFWGSAFSGYSHFISEMVRTKTRAALKGRVDQYQVWTCLLPRICIPALKLFFFIGRNKFYNADKYILQVVQMQIQLLNLYFLLKNCTKRLDSAVSGNLHPSYESCLNLYKYILQCIQIHSASSTNAITTWKLVQSVWTALFLGICIRAIIDRRRRLLQQLDEIL